MGKDLYFVGSMGLDPESDPSVEVEAPGQRQVVVDDPSHQFVANFVLAALASEEPPTDEVVDRREGRLVVEIGGIDDLFEQQIAVVSRHQLEGPSRGRVEALEPVPDEGMNGRSDR
jgi:hypothetical protein